MNGKLLEMLREQYADLSREDNNGLRYKIREIYESNLKKYPIESNEVYVYLGKYYESSSDGWADFDKPYISYLDLETNKVKNIAGSEKDRFEKEHYIVKMDKFERNLDEYYFQVFVNQLFESFIMDSIREGQDVAVNKVLKINNRGVINNYK